MKIDDKLKANQFLTVISKMNKLTLPENLPINLDYIGGFTRIIQKKPKNEKKVINLNNGHQKIL